MRFVECSENVWDCKYLMRFVECSKNVWNCEDLIRLVECSDRMFEIVIIELRENNCFIFFLWCDIINFM